MRPFFVWVHLLSLCLHRPRANHEHSWVFRRSRCDTDNGLASDFVSDPDSDFVPDPASDLVLVSVSDLVSDDLVADPVSDSVHGFDDTAACVDNSVCK